MTSPTLESTVNHTDANEQEQTPAVQERKGRYDRDTILQRRETALSQMEAVADRNPVYEPEEVPQVVEALSEEQIAGVWEEVLASPLMGEYLRLVDRAGMRDLYREYYNPPEHAHTPIRKLFAGLKPQQGPVDLQWMSDQLGVRVVKDTITGHGRARRTLTGKKEIAYNLDEGSKRTEIQALARYGQTGEFTETILHERVHIEGMLVEDKSGTWKRRSPQVRTYDEANARLSAPQNIIYHLLPDEIKIDPTDELQLEKDSYKDLDLTLFPRAIDTCKKLMALGMDQLHIARMIGEGLSLEEELVDRVESSGMEEETLEALVQARDYELNTLRLQVRDLAQAALQQAVDVGKQQRILEEIQ